MTESINITAADNGYIVEYENHLGLEQLRVFATLEAAFHHLRGVMKAVPHSDFNTIN